MNSWEWHQLPGEAVESPSLERFKAETPHPLIGNGFVIIKSILL